MFVFARTYIKDLLPLYRWAKSNKIRVIYDTDDAIDLVDESNPAYSFSRTRIAQARFMMENADLVTTTTPELASHLRRWSPAVAVIPNSVDPEEWMVQPRDRSGELRIGWAGGNTHYRDVALVTDALSTLQSKFKFQFVVHGLTTMASVRDLYRDRLQSQGEAFRCTPHGRAIREFLDKSACLQYEFHPSVPTCDYVNSLCSLKLDVGVAALSDNPFNRKKSCIKYYEYAMSGAVSLASKVLPYSAEMQDTCEHTVEGWERGLTELLDSDLRARWKVQRDWVLENRSIEQVVTLWEGALSGDASEIRSVEHVFEQEVVMAGENRKA